MMCLSLTSSAYPRSHGVMSLVALHWEEVRNLSFDIIFACSTCDVCIVYSNYQWCRKHGCSGTHIVSGGDASTLNSTLIVVLHNASRLTIRCC